MSDAVYDYPSRPATRTRTRRRVLVLALAVVLLLGGGTALVISYIRSLSARCEGAPARTGDGYNLTRYDSTDQCIGWLTTLDYAFGSEDPATQGAIRKIVVENQRVAEQKEPYVRVAVMMPMTARVDSKLGTGPIAHALEGAYTAQAYTNSKITPYGDGKPLIQLVLANIGYDQSLGTDLSDFCNRLGSLTETPDPKDAHPLVAVTGMGVSVPQTRDAAKLLNSSPWNLASIGSVLTADDMTTRETNGTEKPGLFKVSPSNHAYVKALEKALGAIKKGYLVRDRNDDDYVKTLGHDFIDVFSSQNLDLHQSSFNGSTPPSTGTAALFGDAVDNIRTEEPDVVFYAGRDADLPRLVRSLKAHRESTSPPLKLAVATTGLVVTRSDTEGAEAGPLTTRELTEANITIFTASSTDPDRWAQGGEAPKQYQAFHDAFTTGSAAFPSTDLADGYAIMHFDAVAAAVKAIDAVYTQNSDPSRNAALPTAADVRDKLTTFRNKPIEGAAGAFYWMEQEAANDLWPIDHPVPVLTFPTETSSGPLYKTECQRLEDPTNRSAYNVQPCTVPADK